MALAPRSEPLIAADGNPPKGGVTIRVKDGLESDGTSIVPSTSIQIHPNAVCTTRYNAMNWFPKTLWRQFQKAANLLFLFVALSLILGGCPPRGAGMAVTFAITLVINIALDLWEDTKRRRDDHRANTLLFKRYDPFSEEVAEKQWQDCQVGDLVLINTDEAIPADVLIVASSDVDGTCFLSSASLDGETSLKRARTLPAFRAIARGETAPLLTARAISKVGISLTLSAPTRSIMIMEGFALLKRNVHQLQLENFLLRGMVLRNTDWVIGIVCFVGKNTKVQLNGSATPSKFSDLHHTLNKVLGCFLLYLFVLCGYVSLGSMISGGAPTPEGHGLLCETSIGWIVLWRAVLVFYPLVPVTLYVMTQITKELCKKNINKDWLMQADADGPHACMRSCDLVEELGQVNCVFSDKTGTLTANEMRFAYCCIGEVSLESFLPKEDGTPGEGLRNAKDLISEGNDSARRFFEALALCNDVQVDREGCFQGESPDEVALAETAKAAGVVLVSKTPVPEGLQASIRWPQDCIEDTYTISHTLAFTSDRKRMSVVCPRRKGGALVLTKGADFVMETIMKSKLSSEISMANSRFARQGYRTLVVASREMDTATYDNWAQMWNSANEATQNREKLVEEAAAVAERDLQYIGLTVLEDRLQDGVPESIATIRMAGIRFWMLTGDKVETAEAIAKSCLLVTDEMYVTRIIGPQSPTEAALQMSRAMPQDDQQHALVIDGASLLHILPDMLARSRLFELGMASRACVCCRLSPLQKKELVELVSKSSPGSIALAIGDGANDVPMIQEARVGVGIRGKEGTAAVQSSDVAISQFRFLRNLLFCHGRKAYRRVTSFLLWYMYKQVMISWANVLHASENKFQARSCWPGNLEDPMNLLEFLTFVIIFCERDVADTEAINASWASSLYPPGPQRKLFNFRLVGKWLAFATWHGIVAWLLPMHILTTSEDRTIHYINDGPVAKPPPRNFWAGSITAYTVSTIITYTKLAISVRKNLSIVGVCALFGVFLAYPMVLALLILNIPVNPFYTAELADGMVAFVMFTSPKHLICTLSVPFVALLPDGVEVLLEFRPAAQRDFPQGEHAAAGPCAVALRLQDLDQSHAAANSMETAGSSRSPMPRVPLPVDRQDESDSVEFTPPTRESSREESSNQ